MKMDVKKVITESRRQKKMVRDLPRRAIKVFIENTPIDKGFARRNTKLTNGDTIHANYAYADRLDKGHSKQSPDGMVKPTEDWLKKEYRRIFRRK